MLHKLESLEKDLRQYFDEMDGVSFGIVENGQVVDYDYGDSIGLALDAVSDLIGVIQKGQSYEH